MLLDHQARQVKKGGDSWLLTQLLDLGPKLILGTAIMLTLECSVGNGLIGTLGRNPTLTFFMIGSFVGYGVFGTLGLFTTLNGGREWKPLRQPSANILQTHRFSCPSVNSPVHCPTECNAMPAKMFQNVVAH